ncbi:calcium-binding mitochondrial carrier protein Aralar1 isoform X2 [Drosophila nasuta]|uniref:Calcium-binding mitochondrial carrier protein Aralar1 isoform X2 n=1 Tax=Drosophila albomicans TaxID=7291 RepID=A0A6P8XN94_DROAB|nr:calcium-binding mitochondrial carrier protein Aralar1 isoform X2 [Drosophila albomicans]XP_060647668.1 calcium-binding mitochondrial carrier protein Aralar1 isoform X2 [Drosophila nasuta]
MPISATTPSLLKRASTDKLREVFQKYASIQKDGEQYMTSEDFVRKFLGLFTEAAFNDESVRLLAGIADTSKDGLISFSEFQAFEGLLCAPDALYRTAFQLFDRQGNGNVSYADFADVVQKTELHSKIPFSLDGTFIKRYFGEKKQRLINYAEFTQLLHDFHEEHAMEAFRSKDPAGTGFISPLDFQDIIVKVKRHLLTADVKDNLVAVTEGHRVSFPYFIAFTSLLNNMELIKQIYLYATKGSRTETVTKNELLYAAQTMSQITPLEIDILFQLTGAVNQPGRIDYSDLSNIAPEHYTKHITHRLAEIKAVDSPSDRSALIQVLEATYRFTLASFAGATGATVVYPIDLVKTRMQNQRTGSMIGEVAYRNSWDCFKKVIRHEGVLGLYRGLLPQLMGVAPEKAIKLTVNDFVRDKFTDKRSNIPVWGEVIAGGCGGAAQVIFTNPLEIVKIRLQVAGEIAGGSKISALSVVRELGFFGLYKGAKACLLRDVNFSAIYFPTYAHIKGAFADKDGYNSPVSLLAAGAIAGIPAAALVTPADVIKTRLQVAARQGQTTYTGLWDATKKIMAEEGPRAFWKGTAARVCRSSPQFGVTLFTYELLQRLFYVDFGGNQPKGSQSAKLAVPLDNTLGTAQPRVDHIGGYNAAVPLLAGIESKFGLYLPRFGRGAAATGTTIGSGTSS